MDHGTSSGIALAVVFVGSVARAALGAEQDESIASQIRSRETTEERDHFTGDWLGFRDRLVERGIHFAAGYTGEVLSNLSGGARRGTVYEGLLEMALDLDGERLLGWVGSEVHVSSLYPHGNGLSRRVGDLSTLSNLDAYDTFRLFEFWAQQAFWGERVSLRVGQLAADEEFAITDHGALFLNASLGWPPFISANAPAPAYPVAAPGVRLRVDLAEPFYFQGAVYDGHPGDEAFNRRGIRVNLNGDEGALSLFEAGYVLEDGLFGLPGAYKIGGWYHTGDFEHQRLDDSGMSLADPGSSLTPALESGNWGIYFVLDQALWREGNEGSEQGMNGFLRTGGSPADRNFLGYYVDGGLTYQGLIPGRDGDVAGLAVSYWRVGREARRLSREAEGDVDRHLDYEITLEGTYDLKVNAWWTLQPDLQYVIHPGGSAAHGNAFVIGLRSSIVF